MSLTLLRGQRIKLSQLAQTLDFSIRINACDTNNKIYDISCCGVAEDNKCPDERFFIFYNQTISPKNAVVLKNHNENSAFFDINLSALPSNISKIIFNMTIDGDGVMSEINQGSICLLYKNKVIARFDFSGTDFHQERSLMIAEIYLKGEWRLGITGQGFNGGLSDLLKYFGIEEETSDQNAAPSEISQPDVKKMKLFQRRLKKDLLDGELTPEKSQKLEIFCKDNNLSFLAMIEDTKPEIEKALHKLIADIVSDEKITPEQTTTIDRLCQFLGSPPNIVKEASQTIRRIKKIEKIKSGDISPVNTKSLVLKNGEVVWQHFTKTFVVTEDSGEFYLEDGELFITSDRVIFKSTHYPIQIPLSAIVGYEPDGDFISITCKSVKLSSTFFAERKISIINAYLEQAINKYLRKIDSKPLAKTRVIPQSVKNIVWTRDGGQCVECCATDYLEYDHIIPFAKGGSNSEKNVQLLCRKCNLKKRDKI